MICELSDVEIISAEVAGMQVDYEISNPTFLAVKNSEIAEEILKSNMGIRVQKLPYTIDKCSCLVFEHQEDALMVYLRYK
jgi:hypothetical protein